MCIDLVKLNKRVSLLQKGEILYLHHMVFGTYKVYMNLQRNRILREGICNTAKRRTDFSLTYVSSTYKGELNGLVEDSQRSTSEKDVNYLLMWDYGRWFMDVSDTDEILRVKEV